MSPRNQKLVAALVGLVFVLFVTLCPLAKRVNTPAIEKAVDNVVNVLTEPTTQPATQPSAPVGGEQ